MHISILVSNKNVIEFFIYIHIYIYFQIDTINISFQIEKSDFYTKD